MRKSGLATNRGQSRLLYFGTDEILPASGCPGSGGSSGGGFEEVSRLLESVKGQAAPIKYVEPVFRNFGAGDRVRTGDINLGKVALYQLSYSRTLTPATGSRAPVVGTDYYVHFRGHCQSRAPA